MTLHHAYLIKGWLLDKDPPAAVTEALEAIIAGHGRREEVTITGKPLDIRIGPLSQQTEEEPAQAEIDKTEGNTPRKAGRPRNISPEVREAARQRMIAMQAAKKLNREGGPPSGEAQASPSVGASGATRQAW
jgi:hypothetical protein